MQVFLSYKSENRPFALHLRDQIELWGHNPWIDVHNIPKGAYWPEEIEQGLNISDVIIGVMSPLAVESRNVQDEWHWTIVNHKRLVLLMYEECNLPLNYVRMNYINFLGDKNAALAQLKEALTGSKGPIYRGVSAQPLPKSLSKTQQTSGQIR
jgi:hypothetical protein